MSALANYMTHYKIMLDVDTHTSLQLHKECAHGRDLEKMQSLLPSRLSELEAPRFIFIPVYNPRCVYFTAAPHTCCISDTPCTIQWCLLNET